MSDKYAEPPKDSQIQEWMGSMDAIPEDVLVDALRQLAAYEARCRGDAPLLAIAEVGVFKASEQESEMSKCEGRWSMEMDRVFR